MEHGHNGALLVGRAERHQEIQPDGSESWNAVAHTGHGESDEGGEGTRQTLADHYQTGIVLQLADWSEGLVRMNEHPGQMIRVAIENVQAEFEHQLPRPLHQIGPVPRARETG